MPCKQYIAQLNFVNAHYSISIVGIFHIIQTTNVSIWMPINAKIYFTNGSKKLISLHRNF